MALKSKLINITNTLFIILFFSSCADVGGLVELAVKENINNTVKLSLKERGKVSPSIQPEILNNDIKDSNIAATLLKVQEKKTQKGNSYAIVKFSDLDGVFELFLFSDLLVLNRDNLKTANSFVLTLQKDSVSEINSTKRVNIKKIVPLDSFINKNKSQFKNENLKFSSKLKK